MHEQRTTKITLNSVFDILKLIPLFTVSSKKVTLSNVVNQIAYSLILLQFFLSCTDTVVIMMQTFAILLKIQICVLINHVWYQIVRTEMVIFVLDISDFNQLS